MNEKINKLIKARIDVDISSEVIKCGKFYFSWVDIFPFTILMIAPFPLFGLILGVESGDSLEPLIVPALIWMMIVIVGIVLAFNPIHKKQYNAGKKGKVVISKLSKNLRLTDFCDYDYSPNRLTEKEQDKMLEIIKFVIKIEKSKWNELSIAEKEIVCEIEDFIGDGYDFSKKITKLFIIFEKNKNLIVVENK